MKKLILTAAAVSLAAGCVSETGRDPGAGTPPAVPDAPRQGLRAFASEAELTAFLRALARERARLERRRMEESPPMVADAVQMAAPEAETPAAAPAEGAEESVTNVQHAGVDEGGIVKVHGDHLVILRRGRLFTVRVGGGALQPVSAVDAYAPGADPSGDWYDEMLVSGDQVIVIGYSYSRGGTEVGLFSIDRAGNLTHRSTWHLRSNDYYSSRNYASRLIGGKLVFYTPLHLGLGEDVYGDFPAIRRWRPGPRTRSSAPSSPPPASTARSGP